MSGDFIGANGLEIVDLDDDGRPEILATASASTEGGYWYTLRHEGNALVQTYSSLPREDGLIALATAREAGRSRIVVLGRRSLSLYDGATKQELATYPTVSNLNFALAAGDIDGDGKLEAVVCDEDDLWVYDLLNGTSRTRYGFGCRDLALGQIDGDPQLEIALAGNASGGFVLDGASLTVDWADLRGFGEQVVLADFDGDGKDEVATAPWDIAGLRVLDPESDSQLWEMLGVSVGALAAHDLDGGSGAELVWIDSQIDAVHILDGATPQVLRQDSIPAPGATEIAIGDTDLDGVPDVVWGSASVTVDGLQLFVARSDSLLVTARTAAWGGQCGAAAVGDFLGNGSRELAGSTFTSGYNRGGLAFVLDLRSGRLLRSASQDFPGTSSSSVQGFAAAQLDGDPQLEYCLIGDQVLGCLDGATFGMQWLVNLPRMPRAVLASELDGDAIDEILVATDGRYVHVLEGENGSQKWRSPDLVDPYPGFDRITTLDLGDAHPAVVAGSSWGDSGLTSFLGASGLVSAGPRDTPLRSLVPSPSVDPPQSLVLGQEDGSVLPFEILAGTEGTDLATFPDSVEAIGFADFNRDGTLDLAALMPRRLEIRDGETGLPLWTSPYLGEQNDPVGPLLVGDLDGDSVPELLIGSYYGFALFEAPLFLVFNDGFESGDAGNW